MSHKTKLDVLCSDGSPLGVSSKSVYGQDGRIGVGGAELALMTFCEGFHDKGYNVTLYNNPKNDKDSRFEQRHIGSFDPKEDRDLLIVFRSPNGLVENSKGYKVWWSCDQSTIGDFRDFARRVNKIVTISEFHSDYFRAMYGISDSIPIDLPIRIEDYGRYDELNHYEVKPRDKIPYRCIFTSIPDRGLMQLYPAWEQISAAVPEASLVITSDWRLWDPNLPGNIAQEFRLRFSNQNGVIYRGAIPRRDLVAEQEKAQLHLYPCVYDELFCISVAESQVAGAVPVTSDVGALKTTNMGVHVVGNPYDKKWTAAFVEQVVELLRDQVKLEKLGSKIQIKALKRFDPDEVLGKWESIFFT